MKRGNLLVVAQTALAVALVVLAVAVIVPPPRSGRAVASRGRTRTTDEPTASPLVADASDARRDVVERPVAPESSLRQPRAARRPVERLADRGDRAFDIPPRLDPIRGVEDALPPPPDDTPPVPSGRPGRREAASDATNVLRPSAPGGLRSSVELGPIDDTIDETPYRNRRTRTYSTALSGPEDRWINLRIVVEQPATAADKPSGAGHGTPPESDRSAVDAAAETRLDARFDALRAQIESLGREQNARQQFQMERSARMLERSQHATQLIEVQRRLMELRAELGTVRDEAARERAAASSSAEPYRRGDESRPRQPAQERRTDDPPPGSAATRTFETDPRQPVDAPDSTTTMVTAAAGQDERPVGDAAGLSVETSPPRAIASTSPSNSGTGTLPQIVPGPPFHRADARPANAVRVGAAQAGGSVAGQPERAANRSAGAVGRSRPLPRYQLNHPIDPPVPPDLATATSPPERTNSTDAETGSRDVAADLAAAPATNPQTDKATSFDAAPQPPDDRPIAETTASPAAETVGVEAAPVETVAAMPVAVPSIQNIVDSTAPEESVPVPPPIVESTPDSKTQAGLTPAACAPPAGTTPLVPIPDRSFAKAGPPRTAAPGKSSRPLNRDGSCVVCNAGGSAQPTTGIQHVAASAPPVGTPRSTSNSSSSHAVSAQTGAASALPASPGAVQPGAGKIDQNTIAQAQLARARDLMAKGDPARAAQHARRALEIRPDYPEASRLLSQIEGSNSRTGRFRFPWQSSR